MLKIEVPHHFVIQSEAKDLGNILYVIEIFRYAQQHVFLLTVV